MGLNDIFTSSAIKSQGRIVLFDNIKFILIVLVIYCHLINVGYSVPWKLYTVIYSFHMPLFIMISGYFTNKNTSAVKYWDTTLNFLILFIVFNIVSIYIYIVTYDEPPVEHYIPSFALWYILCMIYWRCMIWFVPDKILKSKITIVATFLLSILPAIFYLDYMAFSRFLSFAPFFLIGWNLRNTDVIERLSQLRPWQKCLFFIFGLGCCLLSLKIPNVILWGHQNIDLSIDKILLFKTCSWFVAFVLSAIIFILIPKKIDFGEGKYTLSYYLLHTLLLFPIFDLLHDYVPNGTLGTILTCITIIVILAGLRRISFLQKLLTLKPLSAFQRYKKQKQASNEF